MPTHITDTSFSGNRTPLMSAEKPAAIFMMDYLQNSDIFSPSFSLFGAEEEEPLRFNMDVYQPSTNQPQDDFFELVFERDDEPLTAPVLFPQNSFEAQELPKIEPFADAFAASKFGDAKYSGDFLLNVEPNSPCSFYSDSTGESKIDSIISVTDSSSFAIQDFASPAKIKKSSRKMTAKCGVRSYFNVDQEFPWEIYVRDTQRRERIRAWKVRKSSILKGNHHPKGYAVRRRVADNRERINGRFVSKAEQDKIRGL